MTNRVIVYTLMNGQFAMDLGSPSSNDALGGGNR
jgi:hypothetical protein